MLREVVLKKVLVLWHEREKRQHQGTLIWDLAKLWQDRGIQVSHIYGIAQHPEADLLFPHIDLTYTPPDYIEFIRSYPLAVNGNVFDISKRRISKQLLCGDENYQGPVIVKTDNNFGGWPERQLFSCWPSFFVRISRYWAPFLESTFKSFIGWHKALASYPIYKTLDDVPYGVFRNKALVVERFLPEQEGDQYFMRICFFLGDRECNVRVAGSNPLLKRSSAHLVEEGLPVPEQIRSFRRELGFDYGKIDYAIHHGEVVIFDANKTPGGANDDRASYLTGSLVDGIWSFLS